MNLSDLRSTERLLLLHYSLEHEKTLCIYGHLASKAARSTHTAHDEQAPHRHSKHCRLFSKRNTLRNPPFSSMRKKPRKKRKKKLCKAKIRGDEMCCSNCSQLFMPQEYTGVLSHASAFRVSPRDRIF